MSTLSLILALAVAADPAPPGARLSFVHTLSSYTGPVRSQWATLALDLRRDEVFVAQGGVVGIYNAMGMEVFEYGQDGGLGVVVGVAVLDDGDQIVLSSLDGRLVLFRCDYRGEPLGRFELTGLTGDLAKDFQPNLITYRDGKIYLAEVGRMNVVVADPSGKVLAQLDVKKLLKLEEKDLDSAVMRGLGVDPEGRILITMPLLFKVALISPDQSVRLFGTRGSVPGRFNIIGKMTADEKGYYYLTDALRSVVMVFDPDLEFLGEFGYRGDEPDNLIAPIDIAAGNGKVWVAQAGNRGVSVFKVELPPRPPPEPAAAPAAPAPPTSAPATPPAKAAPR